MKVLSWNDRRVGRDGFSQQVRVFINLYHPDILFLMETKANSNKA